MEANISYDKRLENELKRYNENANIHVLPEIQSYWANRYLRIIFQTLGYNNSRDVFVQYFINSCKKNETSIFCSIGAGNCDIEIAFVKKIVDAGYKNFKFDCIDINQKMLDRGLEEAKKLNLEKYINFKKVDLNSWTVDFKYDVIIALQCLHHFVELEDIFDKIYNFLTNDGYFITHDMIGRNGHKRWPETLTEINKIWKTLDDKYKFNHRTKKIEPEFVNRDFSKFEFEGIRAQDILPLLNQKFKFELFVFWGGIIDPFISRAFGHNYNPKNIDDRKIIDEIQYKNETLLISNKIKPTQMVASMKKNEIKSRKLHLYGFNPKTCIRKI